MSWGGFHEAREVLKRKPKGAVTLTAESSLQNIAIAVINVIGVEAAIRQADQDELLRKGLAELGNRLLHHGKQ